MRLAKLPGNLVPVTMLKAVDYDKAATVKRLKLDGEGLRTAEERTGMMNGGR